MHILSNSPVTALDILHCASLCSELQNQADKQEWQITQSKTFETIGVCNEWGGGGLINHICSCISKEGS